MNTDEIIKDRLLKLNQGSFDKSQGWRFILDDLLKLSYANGKQSLFDQVYSTIEQYILKIRQLITVDSFMDAEKVSNEMLQFLNRRG